MFFSLLYIDKTKRASVNLSMRESDALQIYIADAITCSRSFRAKGIDFGLISNVPEWIENQIKQHCGDNIPVLAGEFCRDVPPSVQFYPAHFKLDVFRSFGDGKFGNRIGLVDVDTVLLRSFSDQLLCEDALYVYDLTQEAVASTDQEIIKRDLSLLTKAKEEACWYGGEFIYGPASSFRVLSMAVEEVWPQYLANWRNLHHTGDEMVTSAAIAIIRRSGLRIIDVGRSNTVRRWWSARTLQPQIALSKALTTSLLHLPSDKYFLADMSRQDFDPNKFLIEYEAYVRWKSILRKVLCAVDSVTFRRRKFAPTLT